MDAWPFAGRRAGASSGGGGCRGPPPPPPPPRAEAPGGPRPAADPALLRDAAVAAWLLSIERNAPGPWAALGGFRVTEPAGRPARLFLRIHGGAAVQAVTVTGNAARFLVDGGEAGGATACEAIGRDGTMTLRTRARTARFAVAQDGDAILLSMDGQVHTRRVAPVVETVAGSKTSEAGPRLLAPMPGLVVAVEVAPGDRVEAGQVAVTMEAMKVVMRLLAPVAGRVLRVACAPSDTVKGGDLLIEIEPDGDA